MRTLEPDVLHHIGNTSLLALRRARPGNGARVLLKLENENPTGSMKDRMALRHGNEISQDFWGSRLSARPTPSPYCGSQRLNRAI